MIQLKKRTRRKKLEQDLRTKYYYRDGILKIVLIDNSPLGIYAGRYVFLRKYSKKKRKFLIEDSCGRYVWTDEVLQIKPEVNGHELYYTSFPLLIEMNYADGDRVNYRVKNGFSFLRKEMKRIRRDDYIMYCSGLFNYNIPKGYNFCLGYSDNNIAHPSVIENCDLKYSLYNTLQNQAE